jgi:hypothetical protein
MYKKFVSWFFSLGASTRRIVASLMFPLMLGMAAAQTAGSGNEAVTGLGLSTMITTIGTGIKQVIVDNGGLLVVAVLPLLAFYFIWNRVRGLFG